MNVLRRLPQSLFLLFVRREDPGFGARKVCEYLVQCRRAWVSSPPLRGRPTRRRTRGVFARDNTYDSFAAVYVCFRRWVCLQVRIHPAEVRIEPLFACKPSLLGLPPMGNTHAAGGNGSRQPQRRCCCSTIAVSFPCPSLSSFFHGAQPASPAKEVKQTRGSHDDGGSKEALHAKHRSPAAGARSRLRPGNPVAVHRRLGGGRLGAAQACNKSATANREAPSKQCTGAEIRRHPTECDADGAGGAGGARGQTTNPTEDNTYISAGQATEKVCVCVGACIFHFFSLTLKRWTDGQHRPACHHPNYAKVCAGQQACSCACVLVCVCVFSVYHRPSYPADE